MKITKFYFFIILLIVLSLITIVISTCIGAAGFIDVLEPLLARQYDNPYVQLRVPRVLLGFILGAGLAISGVVLQTLFRNDLCSESTLGISSFASLGAILGVYLNYSSTGISFLAFVCATVAFLILFLLIKKGMIDESSRLLLAGISLALIASSFISLVQHLAGVEKTFAMAKWLEGGLEVVGFDSLIYPFFSMLFLFFLALKKSKELDLMQVSFQYARGRGVNTKQVGVLLIFPISLFVGIVTSITGPIAFVGLIIPHIVKFFTGTIHLHLITASFFVGGIFLVIGDLISRICIAPAELPVSIFTGLIGAPFFLMLMFGRR